MSSSILLIVLPFSSPSFIPLVIVLFPSFPLFNLAYTFLPFSSLTALSILFPSPSLLFPFVRYSSFLFPFFY